MEVDFMNGIPVESESFVDMVYAPGALHDSLMTTG
jgi:hypothetical protein